MPDSPLRVISCAGSPAKAVFPAENRTIPEITNDSNSENKKIFFKNIMGAPF
jgi:hypothetical protein